MGSVVSKVTDTLGLTDTKAAQAAQAQAAQAQQFSMAMTEEQLAFQREQYDDWKMIYGDLQENLGDYYKNLDLEDYETRGLQAVQQEFQLARDRVDADLAGRGLSTSGVQAATNIALESDAATKRATVRMNAPDIVAKEKQGFLGIGLGQGTQMLGINANVATSGASNLMSRSNTLGTIALNQSLANQDVMGTIVGAGAGMALGVPPTTLFGGK